MGTCQYSNAPPQFNCCVHAHSEEELKEWEQRLDVRRQKMKFAQQKKLLSYIGRLQKHLKDSKTSSTLVCCLCWKCLTHSKIKEIKSCPWGYGLLYCKNNNLLYFLLNLVQRKPEECYSHQSGTKTELERQRWCIWMDLWSSFQGKWDTFILFQQY